MVSGKKLLSPSPSLSFVMTPFLAVSKRTSRLGELLVKPICKETAQRLIVSGHYSHSWRPNFGRFCFGLFRNGAEEEQDCLGAAVYGCMKTPRARIFECGVPGGWMCELNRFWVSDELGKNAESVFLGASLRLLRRADPTIVAVQSFADGRCGCGTIYKAVNFTYYGFHYTVFFRHVRSGEVFHEQTLTNAACPASMLRANAALLAGDLRAFEVKTYRYILPLHKSFRYTGAGVAQAYPPYERGMREVAYVINATRLAPRLAQVVEQLLKRYPYTREKKLAAQRGLLLTGVDSQSLEK